MMAEKAEFRVAFPMHLADAEESPTFCGGPPHPYTTPAVWKEARRLRRLHERDMCDECLALLADKEKA